MKRQQTKFHADTMSNSQVIRSKKCQNLSLGQNATLGTFFFSVWYFIEAVTTDIAVLFQV